MTETNKNSNNRERLIVLEENMTHIKRDINEVKQQMKEFIDSVDHKYATKDEVYNLRKRVDYNQNNHNEWKRWIIPVIISLAMLTMKAVEVIATGG